MARRAQAIGLILLGVAAGVAGDRLLGEPGAGDGRSDLLRDLWPGGAATETAVPAGAREIEIAAPGASP